MGSVSFVAHKGKKVLLTDVANCDVNEVVELLSESTRIMSREPEGSVLSLADVTNVPLDKTVVAALKKTTVDNRPYVKRGAAVGVEGLRKALYLGVRAFSKRKIDLFDDRESAMDWLAADG
jgi:hypothetical protein